MEWQKLAIVWQELATLWQNFATTRFYRFMRFRLLLLTLAALCTGLVLGLAVPHLLSGPDQEAIRLELGGVMDRECAGLPEEPPRSRRISKDFELYVGADLPPRFDDLIRLRDGLHKTNGSWSLLRTLPDSRRAYLVRQGQGETFSPGRSLWIAAILAALLLLAWLLWKFATILRPFTRVPDLLDADPADVARRALPGQPGIGELLGLDAPDEPIPAISAIDNALDRLEREPVPRGPIEEIRSAARNVESMMEAAMAVGSGDLPIVQRSVALRPLVKEAMARHGVDQLVGGAKPELKVPAKVATLVLDRMLELAGEQARVEIDAQRVRVVGCRSEPQAFGWNLATDLAARYGGRLTFAGRDAEWTLPA